MAMDSVKICILVIALIFGVIPYARCQKADKLREDTTVDAGHYGEIKTAITTNKTKAYLSCESGDMVVTIDFKDPFFGIVYANRDPQSPCNIEGNGKTVYTIRLPLQGCGTREDPPRTFINDIVVRFRKGLIVDEDEVKTIICRYGPPVAPPVPPLVPPPPLPVEPPGIVAKPKRLTEAEIYVIICFLLFLGLLLLGVGLAYYCLKKRNIKIVRKRRAVSSAPASEITKLSGSTMGTLSAFDGFRIPRATAHSTSGSEAALLTQGESIPSDYPSESPSSMQSDVEEIETRETSTVLDEHYRYDNRAYVREDAIQRLEATPTPPPQPRSLATIYEQEDHLLRTEEHERSLLSARRLLQHQFVPPVYAKIRKKQLESVSTHQETLMESDDLEETTRMRFLLPPPPPTSVGPDEHRSTSEFEEPTWLRIPRISTTTVSETRSMSEYLEEVNRRETTAAYALPPPPPQQLPTHYDEVEAPPSDIAEPPAVYRAPATTRHTIDDLYKTTITETQSREDVTKHTRETTQTHKREPPQPKWDVTIRTYPPENLLGDHPARASTVTTDSETEGWDQLSYVSERPAGQPPFLFDPSDSAGQSTAPGPNWDVLIRVLRPQTSVVSSAPSEPDDGESVVTGPPGDDTATLLSEDDRERWKRIITTDTMLRTRLQEAHTVEEFERIRRDERYERLFEPRKWDVIIRILAGPPEPERAPSDTSSTISEMTTHSVASSAGGGNSGNNPLGRGRYRKKSDQMDNRSRRSSLPPVYEYEDFDVLGGGGGTMTPTTTRSRRTSRSSDYDLHSMATEDDDDEEEDIERLQRPRGRGDHGGMDVDSLWSTDDEHNRRGSPRRRGVHDDDDDDVLGYMDSRRSAAGRSIAERSTSEIVEDVPRVFDPSSSDGGGGSRRERRSLLRSSSETVEVPEMIDRADSLVGRQYRHQYVEHHSAASSYRSEEYSSYGRGHHHPSAGSSGPPSIGEGRGHRVLERSSTEILVNSPSLRMAEQATASRGGEGAYSLPETEISEYMR